jgi:hypothetical protein
MGGPCPSCFTVYKDILDHIRKKHPTDQYTVLQLQPFGLLPCPTCFTACKGTHGIRTHQAKIHGISGTSTLSTPTRQHTAPPASTNRKRPASSPSPIRQPPRSRFRSTTIVPNTPIRLSSPTFRRDRSLSAISESPFTIEALATLASDFDPPSPSSPIIQASKDLSDLQSSQEPQEPQDTPRGSLEVKEPPRSPRSAQISEEPLRVTPETTSSYKDSLSPTSPTSSPPKEDYLREAHDSILEPLLADRYL